MALAGRILRGLPLLLLSPILFLVPVIAFLLADLFWLLIGRRRTPHNTTPNRDAVSIVIPNWNGRDLLQNYLPSVVAAAEALPGSEVIVVDNGSTDGSATLLREQFPQARVVALDKNLGFGGGSNTGFCAAKHDIVVLLNSDIRVERDFLKPLIAAFTDERVFAVSCQIFFSDPNKKREETGLTQGWWEAGALRVRHRIDDALTEPFPCFYGGGGSCAFDRRKFLELGGFDELLRPFYLEDTDLGYLAWKRGWKVLYHPASVVYHEHRGTIGKRFSPEYIQSVLHKNFVLFCWKNIHEWPRLIGHFCLTFAGAFVSLAFGPSPERTTFAGIARAFLQLPGGLRSRWRARSLAAISDTEAFRRPLGGYFRDRFGALPQQPDRFRVLFISPYPICPPVHGGGVFMYQTCRELSRLTELHLIVLLDSPHERAAHDELVAGCRSAEFLVRLESKPRHPGSILPHAIQEYSSPDLEWLIHRQIYLNEIDAVQYDYLPMGQYRAGFRRIGEFLFEHDIYFQSIGRQLRNLGMSPKRASAFYEYLRAVRYELRVLPDFDRVQVCTRENKSYLTRFLPSIAPRTDDSLRAGIDTCRYPFTTAGREPYTMLFLGSFRHLPNAEALHWLANHVLPLVLALRPEARLVVIGSDPPAQYSLPDFGRALELRGFVDDILEPLSQYSVFVCPILSGSGVRVKLLEAFAAGIPAVSTRIGAEGLAREDGDVCALADDPNGFAEKILWLFDHPCEAVEMARRARAEVEANWDTPVITRRLVESYRETIAHKRKAP
jgi:GT2 family glycosyltransferase